MGSVSQIATVREFNRFYTRVIGVLREGLLSTPYTLTEARVLFELARRDATDVVDLRRTLALDAGYLSRVLRRFEADGLVGRRRSPADGRRQTIHLTRQGRAAFAVLDERSAEEIAGLLAPLGEEARQRLVAAMRTIQEVLEGGPRPAAFVLRPLRAGDLGWVVYRHGVVYAEEYGWDSTFEALVARIVADYAGRGDTRREHAWIAEVDGQRVGCVFCMDAGERVAQLRLLLVEPSARGLGIGARLVDECLRFARHAGYHEIMLWTNDVLAAARRIYEQAGFTLVKEEPHRSFGHDLTGQYWSRPLHLPSRTLQLGS